MAARLGIAAALALASAPAHSQPISAHFAPPIDRDIRYEVTETRRQGSLSVVFSLEQHARFVREARGYRMKVTLRSARTDAPTAIAQRFDAAFRPFVGLDVELRLSADGKPLGMVDEAGTWSRLLTAIEAVRADKALAPSVAGGIEAVFTSIAALPPDARATKLMENPLRLIGFALPAMSAGETVATGDAREGASATLRAVGTAELAFDIGTRRPVGAAAALRGEGNMVIDRATGLLRSAVTREWIVIPDQPASAEPDAIIAVKRVD